MKNIFLPLVVCLLILVTAIYAEETGQIFDKEIARFLEFAKNGRSNPNGLICLSHDVFKKGYILPENYENIFLKFFIKEENNIKYYSFLSLDNDGGSWWVKLEVNAGNRSINKLDAMGETDLPPKKSPKSETPINLILSELDILSWSDSEGVHHPAMESSYKKYPEKLISTEGILMGIGLPSALGSHQYVGLHEPATPGKDFMVPIVGNIPPTHGSFYKVTGKIIKTKESFAIDVIKWEEIKTKK